MGMTYATVHLNEMLTHVARREKKGVVQLAASFYESFTLNNTKIDIMM